MAMLLRDAGYRTAVIGKWGLGTPGTTGQPDKKGFDYAFGFLDHRHAHRQFTDHLYRNAERVPTDPARDYVNDLFTQEAEAFITRPDPKPFFLYLNYTVPHAELRAPEDSMAPHRGGFPRNPSQRRGRRASRRSDDRGPLARIPVATRAARGVRRDDHAHGSGHRPPHHAPWRARPRRSHAHHVRQRQRPAPGRRRRSGLLQERRRAARDQARSLRGRHPRADDRALARDDPRRPRQRPCLDALGHAADAVRAGGREDATRDRRAVDDARAPGPAAADARLPVLGVPRARIPAGGAHGTVEGRPAGQGCAARALRPRERPARGARRGRRQSRRGREDRAVPAVGANRVGPLGR